MAHVARIAAFVLWTADEQRAPASYRDLPGLGLVSPPTLRNAFLGAARARPASPPQGRRCATRPPSSPEAFDAQRAALAAGYSSRGRKRPVPASGTMHSELNPGPRS
jgi:hypothetical protein